MNLSGSHAAFGFCSTVNKPLQSSQPKCHVDPPTRLSLALNTMNVIHLFGIRILSFQFETITSLLMVDISNLSPLKSPASCSFWAVCSFLGRTIIHHSLLSKQNTSLYCLYVRESSVGRRANRMVRRKLFILSPPPQKKKKKKKKVFRMRRGLLPLFRQWDIFFLKE